MHRWFAERVAAFPPLAGRWTSWIARRAPWVVAATLLAAAGALYFSVHHLGVHTDTNEMLDPDLPFQRTYHDYRQIFPQYTDTLLVVIEAATPDRADQAADTLARALSQDRELFNSVYLPQGGAFLEEHALLYLDTDQLQELADKLAAVQPFIGKLTRDPNLRGLFTMLGTALKAARAGEPVDPAPLLNKVDEAVLATLNGRYYQMSWQSLIQGDGDTAAERRFIVVQPHLDYSRLQPAAPAIGAIRQLVKTLGLDTAHGVEVKLTGEVALAYEELETAGRGAWLTGLVSLLLVGAVLLTGLRAWQLVLAAVLTLAAGLTLTAGFAALAVGNLNLISIAFAVLYIGLGVDYSIHVCLRYRELLGHGVAANEALQGALRDVGGSLLLCTVTTATGFYAFVPTAFAGISELGLIAGTGMIISLLLNISLLPALLALLPPLARPLRPEPRQAWISRLMRLPVHHSRSILAGATLLAVGAVVLLPGLRFDFNPVHLRDPQSESVMTFNALLKDSDSSPWTITVLAADATGARELAAKLERLDVVDHVLYLDSFIPEAQEQKTALLQDLSLIIGAELNLSADQAAIGRDERVRAIRSLITALERNPGADPATAALSRQLQGDLQHLLGVLNRQTDAAQAALLSRLEHSLLGALPRQLQRLRAGLNATPVSLDTLPRERLGRWQAADGRWRIEVFPRKSLERDADLVDFVTAVQALVPDATEAAVINLEAGKVVTGAFAQALVSALGVISLLLLLLLPKRRDALLVLAPLLLAALLTSAAMVLLELPFNFANVIALPLLLGVGVDSGVHMVHRYHTVPPRDGDLLGTSTSRAVLLSALTTLCSFGALAFSPHPGAASMGRLLTIGIITTVLCTLLVLPALLTRFRAAP